MTSGDGYTWRNITTGSECSAGVELSAELPLPGFQPSPSVGEEREETRPAGEKKLEKKLVASKKAGKLAMQAGGLWSPDRLTRTSISNTWNARTPLDFPRNPIRPVLAWVPRVY